jgi:hypothetical protein
MRPPGHEAPYPSVDACGGDSDEDVVVAEGGVRDLAELEDVGDAVAVLDDGRHRPLDLFHVIAVSCVWVLWWA